MSILGKISTSQVVIPHKPKQMLYQKDPFYSLSNLPTSNKNYPEFNQLDSTPEKSIQYLCQKNPLPQKILMSNRSNQQKHRKMIAVNHIK